MVLTAVTCVLLPVMVTMDTTVVNVAQRTFIADFSTTQAVVAWTQTAYTLSLAAVIPLTGWAANRSGTKRLVLGSVLLFSLGSLLCALASNIALLVAFRALQGLGGGMLTPLQLIILARAAGPQRLGRVLTLSMVPILMAPMCGPILGGWLIDSFGWQWIFLINIPIGLLTMVLAGFVLPQDVPLPTESLDVISMLLLSPGLVLLLYGVSLLPARGTIADPFVWVPVAAGTVLIGAFVIHALRWTDRALIDLHLLEHRAVAAANATRFLFAVAFFGSLLLFPAYFQQVLGKTPLESGLFLVPQTASAAVAIPIVGRLMERRGPRRAALIGTALTAMGLAVFVYGMSREHVDLLVLLAGLAMFGVGTGGLMTPVTWAAIHTLDSSEVAHGSTLFNVNHNTAASVGAALMSVIVTSRFNANATITAAKRADSIREEAASRAYAGVFVVSMIVVAATAIPAWFLPNRAAPPAAGRAWQGRPRAHPRGGPR
ncbi:hypothetical protein AWC15_06015 [Mycobacterium lacus]|nr:hypothetical protein AWC15_06015 [Mycobacterium lacus]